MKFERLAGLGALAVTAGILAVWLLLAIFVMRPSPDGGIDWVNAWVAWISTGLVALALVAVHLVVARQLFDTAKGKRFLP